MSSGGRQLRAVFCSVLILSTFISGSHSASCCLRYTKRPLPCTRLLGYTIQTINTSCDINAIIFHVRGRFVCADPLMNWTQRGMNCVDEMRKKEEDIINKKTHLST